MLVRERGDYGKIWKKSEDKFKRRVILDYASFTVLDRRRLRVNEVVGSKFVSCGNSCKRGDNI